MRLAPALAVLTLLASIAQAGIRVYEPPAEPVPAPAAKVASPTVSRGMPAPEAPAKSLPPKVLNEDATVNPFTGEAKPAAKAPRLLEVFVPLDQLPLFIAKYKKPLQEMPELKQLNLEPTFYMSDEGRQGMQRMAVLFQPKQKPKEGDKPPLSDIDISVDLLNERALSYGIQNQSTIVYRDPSGAVRLYNLNYEIEKLQRQLAREIQDAQPAR